jgi:hypothetical protein
MTVRQEAYDRESKATGQLEVLGKIRPAEISILKLMTQIGNTSAQCTINAQNSKNQEILQ